jgi:hypothetical protein
VRSLKPNRAADAPPGTPRPASPLAIGSPSLPETIRFTLEPFTTVLQGCTYRTEPAILLAGRVSSTKTSPPPEPASLDKEERSIAAKVFELLAALDPDSRLRKAPPLKVFLLRFRQNLSLSQIARICNCGRSLIALRLCTIQQRLPWQPRQLRELSAHVEAMQDALADSRARSIYRKGAAYGDEGDDRDSG